MNNRPLYLPQFAYTRNGHRVEHLRKSKYGGWYGDIYGVNICWMFNFCISPAEIYNQVDRRRLRKGELDIIRLPSGFDYTPAWATKEDMLEVFKQGVK